MSIRIMSLIWKIRGDSLTSTETTILVRMADFAADDGSSVYPSIGRIAEDTKFSERAVQKSIVSLLNKGVLEVVEPSSVHKPNVYKIHVNHLEKLANSEEGCTTFTSRGAPRSPLGVHHVHPIHHISTIYPSDICSSTLEEDQNEDIDVSLKPRRRKKVDLEQQESDFQQWYDVYPRKAAREDAKKAFVKAIKFISLGDLLQLTKGYARSVEDKDTQYLPYPATWLNGQRWKDQPTPSAQSKTFLSQLSIPLPIDKDIGRFLEEHPSIKGNSLSSGFNEARVLKESHKIIIYHPFSFMLSRLDFFKADLEAYFGKPIELRKMQ